MNNNRQERGSIARIISFIVLIGIIPAWFFYLGVQFTKTLTIVSSNHEMTNEYLKK
ncbi:hypothetical protein H7Y21_04005 [Arenimonas sp.]|nr:hypothetical protein [Candidatus Parcubacteria bacterium]